MTDDDLFALCISTEAGGEPYEGKVAVGKVIRNRMVLKYQSDGTVVGTVLRPYAFSAFMFDWVDGKYVKVAVGLDAMQARAETLLETAQEAPSWPDCLKAVTDSEEASGFTGGAQFSKLTSDTVLYVNPVLSSPAWASPDKFVCQIYHHSFYRA